MVEPASIVEETAPGKDNKVTLEQKGKVMADDQVAAWIKEKQETKAAELTALGKTKKDYIGITYADIQKRITDWNRTANILRAIHISIAFISVVSSLTVASGILGNDYTKVAAFLAAISAGILASFNISDKSDTFRDAWSKLNEAKLRYDAQDDFVMQDLIDAYVEGERIISKVAPVIQKKS